MYYSASENLIRRNTQLRSAIEVLDREIAHAYHASGRGRIEQALLRHHTGLDRMTVDDLLREYVRAGIAQVLEQWEDVSGHAHDPDEAVCPECGADRSQGTPGATIVRVLQQPRLPAFDPDQQSAIPDVFISYRRSETGTLAADLFYLLQGHGIRVFLDRSDIVAGADPPREFLDAASNAPTFIALVSRTYFDSLPCTMELAHAARARNRLLRVNVAPVPTTPAALVWFDQPNWVTESASPTGLSTALAEALLKLVRLPKGQNVMDLRRDACRYLLEKRSRTQLLEVLARLPWMREFDYTSVANTRAIVNDVHLHTSDNDLPTLCAVLRPA